jgi:hypothetical protein
MLLDVNLTKEMVRLGVKVVVAGGGGLGLGGGLQSHNAGRHSRKGQVLRSRSCHASSGHWAGLDDELHLKEAE